MESPSLLSILEISALGSGLAQQTSLARLLSFEGQDGYIEALCGVASSISTVREDVRLLAVISLKNLAGRSWTNGRSDDTTSSRVPVASPREKTGLRAFLLQQFEEPNRKVFLQFSALTASLARADWPENWPELLPSLFEEINKPEPSARSIRAMYVLSEVLEVLKSKQLPIPRKALIAESVAAFPALIYLWGNLSNSMSECISMLVSTMRQSSGSTQLLPLSSAQTARPRELLDTFCLCSSVLLKVFDRSFPDLYRSHPDRVASFFENIAHQLVQLLAFVRESQPFCACDDGFEDSSDNEFSYLPSYDSALIVPGAYTEESKSQLLSSLLPSARRVVRELAHIPEYLQKEHPVWMSAFVEPYLRFFFEQLVQEYTAGFCASLEAFRISAVLFLSNTLSCREYDEDATSQNTTVRAKMLMASKLKGSAHVEDTSATLAVARNARNIFFKGENVLSLLRMSLQSILPYGRADLEAWKDDPEQFWISMQALREGDTARSAAEGLVLGLLDGATSSTDTTSFILALLYDVNAQASASRIGASETDVCFWDSVFLCAGFGASLIGQQIDANLWLQTVLGPLWMQLLSHPSAGALPSGQQLLRHRLLWLLRCWFYQFDPSCHSDLFGLAVSVLDPANASDLVVCMEACLFVETALDADVLTPDLIAPMLVRLVENFVSLVNRLDDSEPQSTIIGVTGKLIQSAGLLIKPAVSLLMAQFTTLWRNSESPSPLQNAILEAFAILVNCGREAADGLVEVLSPLVSFTCSGAGDASHLLQDGVSLWLALMRNLSSAAYTPTLDILFRSCFGGLFTADITDLSAEALHNLMLIIEAYAIICGAHCLTYNADILQLTFQKLLCQVAPKSVQFVLRPIEAFFLACPRETAQFLLQSGILLAPLRACAASTKTYTEIFGDLKEQDVANIGYLSLVARLLLVDPGVLYTTAHLITSQLPTEFCQRHAVNGENFFRCLVQLLVEKFDVCGYGSGCCGVWRQKLWILALLTLYPKNTSYFEWFPVVYDRAKEFEAVVSFDQKVERIVQSMFSANDEDNDEHRVSFDYESDADSDKEQAQNIGKRTGVPLLYSFMSLLCRDTVYSDSVASISSEKCRDIVAATAATTGKM
jgi:hypothetical protein